MASTAPHSDRATRASTRSQTAKSRDNGHEDNRPTLLQRSGRVEKPRTTAARKARTQAQRQPKPAAKSRPEHSEKADDEVAETNNPSQTATVLTINDTCLKAPLLCHQYIPQPTNYAPTPSPVQHTPLIFTHGAGGTLSAPAVVHFCTGFSSTSAHSILAFPGSMNLGARVKGFHACHAHSKAMLGSAQKDVLFGGRSMGARAAVVAASEIMAQDGEVRASASMIASVNVRLVLVSYPLQGPKDVRDRILLELPEGVEVLFVVGDRDAMCPLDLLEEVRGNMSAVSRVVVVRGADHGMNVKPARRTREVGEEAGKLAARWVNEAIEREGEVVYVGDVE